MMTATCALIFALPDIHRRGRERSEQRAKITRQLQDKLTNREYAGLLYMATMSTLHHQKGRTSAMFVPLAPATRRKGVRDILPHHWQMTPWRPRKARPEYKKTKVGEPFQKWETTQKSRYKGNNRRRRRRRKTMERILRWEIGKRNKNKGKDKEKSAGHGNNKMIEFAWMIPPWDLRFEN